MTTPSNQHTHPEETPDPYHNKFTPLQETWLTALESGGYKQTQKMLKYTDNDYDEDTGNDLCKKSYCCLGVLCVINDVDIDDRNSLVTPIQKELLTSLKIKLQALFINLNDDKSFTFPQIAEEVRKNPSLYFINFDMDFQVEQQEEKTNGKK